MIFPQGVTGGKHRVAPRMIFSFADNLFFVVQGMPYCTDSPRICTPVQSSISMAISSFVLTGSQKDLWEDSEHISQLLSANRNAREYVTMYKQYGLPLDKLPEKVVMSLLSPDEERELQRQRSFICLSHKQLAQSRLLILITDAIALGIEVQWKTIQLAWNQRWFAVLNLEQIFTELLEDLRDCEVDLRDLRIDDNLPWDLLCEIYEDEVLLAIKALEPEPVLKKAPEIIYTGTVHVPKKHLDAKAEENPDSYVWLVLIERNAGFRGIAGKGSSVFLVRTYGQFHGIPKHGFNSMTKKVNVALGELVTSLGLERTLSRLRSKTLTYESAPYEGQKKKNFCFIYEMKQFDVRSLPEVKHHDPENPKFDQRIWIDSTPIFDKKARCKQRLNKQTGETLRQAISFLDTSPDTSRDISKPKPLTSALVKATAVKTTVKVVCKSFATLADDDD